MSTQAASNVAITGGSISGITDLAIADGGTGASDAATARTNLGLAIGTNVQAYDAQLADIAGLTPTDNNFIVGNGTNFVTESGSTARTSLGLGSIATQDSNNVSITGGSISGITDLAIADGGTGASTTAAARTNLGLDGFVNMKNRIINGAMVIDQRNAGASVTPASTPTYTLDRWNFQYTQNSKFSTQQSTIAPANFRNSLLVTSLAATSVAAGDIFLLQQSIEGFNCADLNWGTANAQTVTLSFWVRSSLTGTFGGALLNSAQNRSYPFSYTISSANTWEQKSITIAGDTTGTWATDNSIGIRVTFGLGGGSTYSGTAGAWAGAAYYTSTGATSVVGTNGATFYITGVQLEVGSTATSFDYRPYGTELVLCQRYFARMTSGTGTNTTKGAFGTGISTGTRAAAIYVQAPQPMRALPTFGIANLIATDNTSYDANVSAINGAYYTNQGVRAFLDTSSDMTVGKAAMLAAQYGSAAAGYVEFSAEL